MPQNRINTNSALSSRPAVIIPAAGFGRRVGSPAAKELFLHPQQKVPLIEVALQRAFAIEARPVVITRESKTELLDYLRCHSQIEQIQIQIIPGSIEWPDTVMQSENYWSDENLLLLPDTDFLPQDIPHKMILALQNYETTWAVHQVSDGRTWGCLQVREGSLYNCEKPVSAEPAQAWGLIGFRRQVGQKLFRQLLESTMNHQWFLSSKNFSLFELESFADLTRSSIS